MTPMAKPLASLSSTLLARKGQARPAMRPQGFASLPGQSLEDLGWNDMGAEAPIAAEMPVEAAVEAAAEPLPPVLAERAALREEIEAPRGETEAPQGEIEAPRAVRAVSVATAARLGRETARQLKSGRAAFTLRLDADRHLRLRLASAVAHRSAQQLVQHALDQFLTTLPEVEALIAQLPSARPAAK